MSYIITTRNPATRKLVIICDLDNADQPAEYESIKAAAAVAADIPICKAWGFDVIEIPRACG